MKIALFDLDGTLIPHDSDREWITLLDELGLANFEEGRHFFESYALQRADYDVQSYNRFMLAPFAEHPLETLLAARETFVERRIAPRVNAEMRAVVDHHLVAGHECTIVTGSQRFVTEPIASFFGIPNLLATEAETKDGNFTGATVGPPCFGPGKCDHVESWLGARGKQWEDVSESWYYADSHHDLPLFERVDHPIAVQPNETLGPEAVKRGWEILRPYGS